MTYVTVSRILLVSCLVISVEVTAQRIKPRLGDRTTVRSSFKGRTYRHQDNTEQEIKCEPCSEMRMKACQVRYDVTTLNIDMN